MPVSQDELEEEIPKKPSKKVSTPSKKESTEESEKAKVEKKKTETCSLGRLGKLWLFQWLLGGSTFDTFDKFGCHVCSLLIIHFISTVTNSWFIALLQWCCFQQTWSFSTSDRNGSTEKKVIENWDLNLWIVSFLHSLHSSTMEPFIGSVRNVIRKGHLQKAPVVSQTPRLGKTRFQSNREALSCCVGACIYCICYSPIIGCSHT